MTRDGRAQIRRLSSGVPGLDAVLGGGEALSQYHGVLTGVPEVRPSA